jgi:hypothetical protein
MRRWILLPLLVLSASAGEASSPSAFRFAKDRTVKASIDLKEVLKGIPRPDPRDAIPAIRKPEHIPARKATWLGPMDRVLGIAVGREARAYPLKILVSHEIANDILAGTPIGASY